MKSVLLFVAAITTNIAAPASADDFRPEGRAFRPIAPVAWAATNIIPSSLVVYQPSSQTFSTEAISNAMAVGSFKPANRINTPDKTLIQFQDNRDKSYMTRYLQVFPEQGRLNYYDRDAKGDPIKGVPTSEESRKLAMDYFRRFVGNSDQFFEAKPFTETTMTTVDRKDGRETDKAVMERGAIIARQVDGIQLIGNTFWIVFGNEAKPTAFQLRWPKLQPVQRYITASRNDVLGWIKAGNAVNADPYAEAVQAKKWSVTQITPFYKATNRNGVELVFPFANVEITADMGKGSNTFLSLYCPIILTNKPLVPIQH
jgi:hypothetical protein